MKSLLFFILAVSFILTPAIFLYRRQLPPGKSFLFGILSMGSIHFLVYVFWQYPWTVEGGLSSEIIRFLPIEASGPLVAYKAYMATFLIFGFPVLLFLPFEFVTHGGIGYYILMTINSFIWGGMATGIMLLIKRRASRLEEIKKQSCYAAVGRARQNVINSKQRSKVRTKKTSKHLGSTQK